MPAYSWSQQAHHMGQLKRGDSRWEVYLEVVASEDRHSMRGRVHFVAGERHRESAWIFLEWSEREVKDRFNEFSGVELWNLCESLGP